MYVITSQLNYLTPNRSSPSAKKPLQRLQRLVPLRDAYEIVTLSHVHDDCRCKLAFSFSMTVPVPGSVALTLHPSAPL